MNQDVRSKAVEILEGLETTDAELRKTLQAIVNILRNTSDSTGMTVGNISSSTGVAIGNGIRQVVNHFNLPPEAAAALIDLRVMLGSSLGLDTSQYQIADLILDRTREFVGRDHVFEQIDKFVANNSSGYLTIEGDPGLGKSAILAEYVRRKGCIVHFNVRALGVVSSAQFLQNVCAQLIAEANLPYASLPAEATQDGAFLLKLLKEAGAKRESGEKLVIAVDALDEVDLAAHPTGANILFLPPTLPEGIYFIMTRRQVAIPFSVRATQELLDLMSFPAENKKDVEIYLTRAVERPLLRAWIDQQSNLSMGDFVNKMVDLSESNFMYLRYVLPEIEKGQYKELNIDKLPRGLEGYYDSHWVHMGMMAKPLPRTKIRIVYVLCEARQPVTRSFIAHIAKDSALQIDDLAVQEVLDEWDQFLHEQESTSGKLYSIYHASFRDFLYRKDIVRASEVTKENINAVIADNLWTDLYGEEKESATGS
jgi:hypothetical protein